MCPVCGKKVGAWRKPRIHPKCRERAAQERAIQQDALDSMGPAIQALTQAQRDAILRRMVKVKPQ